MMQTRWGIEWYSNNSLDGGRRHIVWKYGMPLLFFSKKEAAQFIRKEYGYIAKRQDLRREPHGWRVPHPILVNVTIAKVEGR